EDMKCEEKILIYFDKRLEWLYEQSNILTQITQEELNLFNELGTDIVKEINLEERKNFTNIFKKCIEKNEIEIIDIEKVSNYIFILTDGIYNNYRTPSSMELVTEKETEMIKNEVSNALKIFIQGLKSPNSS
ncbi:MAG: hypothetical protein ACFFAE_22790, partial [Candidatus Hodarchaeota archaeon]